MKAPAFFFQFDVQVKTVQSNLMWWNRQLIKNCDKKSRKSKKKKSISSRLTGDLIYQTQSERHCANVCDVAI